MAYDYWFVTPLICLGCGAVIPPAQTNFHAHDLNPILHDVYVHPEQVLPITLEDFDAAYARVRDPKPGEQLRAIGEWACPISIEAQWARTTFELLPDEGGVRFIGAESVPLTAGELGQAHFIDNALPGFIRRMPEGPERARLAAAIGSAAEPMA